MAIAATLTVGLPNYGTWLGEGWHRLVGLAKSAEDSGIDRISTFDHLVMGPELDTYPYGSFPGGSDNPWLEPLTTLAAIAGGTERIRLATGVLVAPVRSAAVLAKTAATLDVLSEGRLDLGVGTGWQAKEYEAVGLDFADRGQLFTDVLAACQALWKGGPTTFESPSISFTDVWCSPRPVQEGGVPLWIGGALHKRNVERIVKYGTGWLPSPGAPRETVEEGIALLRREFEEAGRDPQSLFVRTGLRYRKGDDGALDAKAALESAIPLIEAGVTDLWLPADGWAPTPEAALGLFNELGEAKELAWA